VIYTPSNSKGLILVDNTGTRIPAVYEFNDETCEVKFYLIGDGPRKPHFARSGNSYQEGYDIVRASAVIKGAKMIQREESP
jgi:hypothetical protein